MSARTHPIRNQRVIAVAIALSLLAAPVIPILHSSKLVAAVPGQPITQAVYPNFADIGAIVQPTVVNIATTSSHLRSLTRSDSWHEPRSSPWSRRFFEGYGASANATFGASSMLLRQLTCGNDRARGSPENGAGHIAECRVREQT